ncbi:MAG: transglutaminase-like cysteine peptidase protein [Rhizobium sp.]|nr:transglutaminase-like cysteine peptidase protein [Rhizobium sp.]
MKSLSPGIVLLALLLASACSTREPTAPIPPAPRFTTSQYIQDRQRVAAPFAHVVFCKDYAAECAKASGPAAVKLTASAMEELQTVNGDVNAQIVAQDDTENDTWTLFPRFGDCDDFAVSKRHELIARGWPAPALRLAIGVTPENEGHMVLVARTSRGDLVLDNRDDRVKPWQDADLTWRSIQSLDDPHVWHRI